MARETRITVACDDVDWLAERLAGAGLTVLDTGERVTTDEGVDAEAVLQVAALGGASTQGSSKQGTRLRP
jgi:hypothetical protein